MISFAEAFATILRLVAPLDRVTVPLAAAQDAYLAEPITTPFAVPRFANSAMDGFGVRLADVGQAPIRLRICGVIRAGDPPGDLLPPGAAVKILTGAPVPPGVDAVVMKEECAEEAGEVTIRKTPRLGENIRPAGEEYRQGDAVFTAGTHVTPPVIGLLASLGFAEINIYRQPSVALLITGDELVSPGVTLAGGQIYDSNSPMLVAVLNGLGLMNVSVERVPDEPSAVTRQLAAALRRADIVITVGGISVGDFDFVKAACGELGIATHVWQVAIKPGKPFYFGTHRRVDGQTVPIFGLPGNPVSALVTFLTLVKPGIRKMLGADDQPPAVCSARLTADIRKKAGRMEFLRGVAEPRGEELVVTPAIGQESHMLSGMAQANCLLHFPCEAERMASGEIVQIEWINW